MSNDDKDLEKKNKIVQNLIPKKTEAIIQKQYQLGALAITPVGGGDGGHILIHAPSNNLAYQKNPDVITI